MDTIEAHMTEMHEQLKEVLGSLAVEPLTDDNLQPIAIPNTHPYCVSVYMPNPIAIEINCIVLVGIDLDAPGLKRFLFAEQRRLPFVHFEYDTEDRVLLVCYQSFAAGLELRQTVELVHWIALVAEDTARAIGAMWGPLEERAA